MRATVWRAAPPLNNRLPWNSQEVTEPQSDPDSFRGKHCQIHRTSINCSSTPSTLHSPFVRSLKSWPNFAKHVMWFHNTYSVNSR